MKHFLSALLIIVCIPVYMFAQAPQITTQPVNTPVCQNADGLLKVVVTGAEPLTYEWFKNDVSIGNDANILNFMPATAADEAEYYCEISNSEGSVTSNTVVLLVVDGLPIVNSVSGEGDYCSGISVTLSLDAENGPNSFQWRLDGDDITGGYGPALTFDDLSQENEGVYTCEVSNVCGSVISDEINVLVTDPVNILTQPATQTACNGDDVEFEVIVEGAVFMHDFQWYEDGVLMPGETSSVLLFEDVETGNNSFYSCVVSNTCNSVESNAVGMMISTYPSVTASPLSNSACLGENITLYSTATGSPVINSQWYINGEAVVDSVNASLTITTQEYDTLYVYNTFTNGCGTVNSDSAIIVTDMPPEITQQPEDSIACSGNDVIVNVKATGKEPMSYQWQLNGVDVYGWQYSGQNSSTLQIEQIHEGLAGEYTCIVSNSCGMVTSEVAIVTVNLPPLVAVQPVDLELCQGETAEIEIEVQGTEPIEFSWRKVGSPEVLSTDETFTIESLEPTDDGLYYCVVSNLCEDVHTDTVELHVKLLPSFNLQPVEMDLCQGDSAALQVSVLGEGPMDLLWFRNSGALSGETDSILIFNPAETLETGDFMCVAMNECGITESDEVNVNIGTAPAITWQPYGQSLCENEELILYSDATGENVFYQWYNNGEPIPGQNDTALVITFVDSDMDGTFFFQAYNGCASVNSDVVNVTVHPAPEFDLGPDQDLCDGESIVLSTDVLAQSYNWNQGLSTSADLEVNETGAYTLAAVGENGCIGYDTVMVEFHPYYTPILGEDLSNCGSFILDAGEGAYSYDWNTGEDSQSIDISESGQYYVTTAGDDFGCLASDTINITILEVPVIDLGADHTIARDSVITLSVEEGFLAYYWSNGSSTNTAEYSGDILGAGTHEAWVNVTSDNGCYASDTVLITVMPGESVNQLESGEAMSLYPNPAQNSCFVDFDMNDEVQNLEIVDMRGRIIHSQYAGQRSGTISIDINDLQKGLYIIRVNTHNRTLNYRLIKN